MWFQKSEQSEPNKNPHPGGIDFETAAARVTLEDPEVADADTELDPADEFVAPDEEALLIKPGWAIAVAKGCFYPAARWVHPAYAIRDEQAEQIAPAMQVFLQTLADKYAPAAISRLANRHPEFWDLVAKLGVLYYQQWRAVSQLVAEEERARLANAKNVTPISVMPMPPEVVVHEEPERKVVGERMRDGSLVI